MKYFSKWESVKHRVPQGLIHGPLFFIFYIDDLPKMMSDMSKLILFANDMSKIVTNSDPYELKQKSNNNVFTEINIWFKSNLLSLNFDETYYLFMTKNNRVIDM